MRGFNAGRFSLSQLKHTHTHTHTHTQTHCFWDMARESCLLKHFESAAKAVIYSAASFSVCPSQWSRLCCGAVISTGQRVRVCIIGGWWQGCRCRFCLLCRWRRDTFTSPYFSSKHTEITRAEIPFSSLLFSSLLFSSLLFSSLLFSSLLLLFFLCNLLWIIYDLARDFM